MRMRVSKQLIAGVALVVLAGASESAPGAVHNVVTSGFTFTPSSLTIAEGDTVRWTYQTSHNVVQVDNFATSCPTPTPGGFNSGPVGSSTMFEFTFNDPGQFFYICQQHCFSAMRGTVTVKADCPGDTNGDNIVNFADLNTVLSQFGQSGSGLSGDVNDDGVVNFADLNIVLSNFGMVC